MMKNVAYLVFFGLNSGSLCAATLISVANGNWDTASTWSPAVAPSDGDTIMILADHIVTVSSNLSYTGAPMFIEVFGSWRFNGGGAKIALPANSQVSIREDGSVLTVGPGASGNSQTITIGGTVYWNGGQDGNVFGPMGWPYDILPIELVAFMAVANADRVNVSWTTATETGTSHFEVQRSADVLAWNTVGALPAAGNSLSSRHYHFEEHDITTGTWYYRLMLEDLDGTRSPQEMTTVRVLRPGGGMRCITDPGHTDRVRIVMDETPSGALVPSLVDPHSGRMLLTEVVEQDSRQMVVRIPEGPPGVRLLHLRDHGTCRFVAGQ